VNPLIKNDFTALKPPRALAPEVQFRYSLAQKEQW